MLRQGISIPRVTLTYPFTTLESGIVFSLFVEKNKDLYYLFQKNMVGGPSIIFRRYHEAGKTKIRGKEMEDQGKQAKTCQKPMLYIYGPSCKTCPPGSFTRRWVETCFKRESSSRMEVVRVEGTWRRNFYTPPNEQYRKTHWWKKNTSGWFSRSFANSLSVPWLLVAWAYLSSY